MRIGIFGGSFNPPHKMHLDIVKGLLENDYLDKIILVPTSNFYPKPGLINDSDRYKMVELMIKNESKISVSDYEFNRLTYTYQTLDHFQKEYPKDQIYFICGSDNLEEMDTWREYKKILGDFKVIVIHRQENMTTLLNKYKDYKDNIIIASLKEHWVSSTHIRKYLKEKNILKLQI